MGGVAAYAGGVQPGSRSQQGLAISPPPDPPRSLPGSTSRPSATAGPTPHFIAAHAVRGSVLGTCLPEPVRARPGDTAGSRGPATLDHFPARWARRGLTEPASGQGPRTRWGVALRAQRRL